jgi:hypothetical protein
MVKLKFAVVSTAMLGITGIFPSTVNAQRYRGLDSLGIYSLAEILTILVSASRASVLR